MSKKIKIEIQCDDCKKTSIGELYRSIWVEEPENLDLVLSDKINVVTCPNCSRSYKVPFPFLCTNVKKGFAIWYEPTKDPQIDEDIEQYRKHMGPSSFYAKAERIKDWDVFKEKLAKLSSQSADHKPSFIMTAELKQKMDGFVNHIAASIHKKTARKIAYSVVSFCCLSFFIVFFRCDNYGFNIGSLIPITAIIIVFSEILNFFLKRNEFKLMQKIKASFSSNKLVRLWIFSTVSWIVVRLFYLCFLETERIYDSEISQIIAVTFLPPILIGFGSWVYVKYIK